MVYSVARCWAGSIRAPDLDCSMSRKDGAIALSTYRPHTREGDYEVGNDLVLQRGGVDVLEHTQITFLPDASDVLERNFPVFHQTFVLLIVECEVDNGRVLRGSWASIEVGCHPLTLSQRPQKEMFRGTRWSEVL